MRRQTRIFARLVIPDGFYFLRAYRPREPRAEHEGPKFHPDRDLRVV